MRTLTSLPVFLRVSRERFHPRPVWPDCVRHQEVRARARQPPRPSALLARGWGVSPERHHWLSRKVREGKAARPVIGVTVWPGRPRRRKYVAFVGAATTNTRHYWAN